MIMDDGSFSTKVLDDESLDNHIEMFRSIMSKKYEILFQNGAIMAVDENAVMVLCMEWIEADPVYN